MDGIIWKEPIPTLLTLSGITIFFALRCPKNAELPILFREDGRIIFEIPPFVIKSVYLVESLLPP